MNRVMRRVVLAAALGAISCKGDPTSSLHNGIDHLVATPSALFIGGPDSSQAVIIEAVDEQGSRLSGNFALVSNTAGITVAPDDSFNLVYNSKGVLVPPKNWTRARFTVTTVANTGSESAVFSVGGKQITVPVRIIPTAFPIPVLGRTASIVGDTVGFGDTLTLTVSAPYRFTKQTLKLFFDSLASSIPNASPVAFSTPDSTVLRFIAPPGIALDTIRIQGVVLDYAPTATIFTLTSDSGFTTTPLSQLPTLVRPDSALLQPGDTVFVTAPVPFKYDPGSVAIPGSKLTGPAGAVVGFSADSSVAFFVIAPGQASAITATKLTIYGRKVLGVFTLTSGADVITSATPFLTASNNAPAVGDTITITAPPALKFSPALSGLNLSLTQSRKICVRS